MRRLKSERSQGLVEFAVVFPLLVFFLFAIFDIGLALDRRATLQHAVREGARFGAINYTASVIKSRTKSQSQSLLTDSQICIGYEDMNADGKIGAGDAVNVKANYTYKPFILRSILSFFNTSIADIDIKPTGSARLETAQTTTSVGASTCP